MSPVADQERTERLAEQHRREIVDAAERLVKGNGLHQLKLRDIAKESGKSLGNLYNYFQNKEAIIEALVEREKSRFLMVFLKRLSLCQGKTINLCCEGILSRWPTHIWILTACC